MPKIYPESQLTRYRLRGQVGELAPIQPEPKPERTADERAALALERVAGMLGDLIQRVGQPDGDSKEAIEKLTAAVLAVKIPEPIAPEIPQGYEVEIVRGEDGRSKKLLIRRV